MTDQGSERSSAPYRLDNPSHALSAIDLDMLAGHLGFALHRAATILRRSFVLRVSDSQVRPMTFNVLVLVGANPGIGQAELAAALALDKGTLANLIKGLQMREWLEVRHREDDRRRKGVFLSLAGVRALERFKAEVATHASAFNDVYTSAEMKLLFELLQRIA